MKKSFITIAIFALFFFVVPVLALDPVPLLINFQGKLTDSNQAPVDGKADITFSVYDAQTSGNLLWSEMNVDVTVTNGIFNVLIGSGTPDTSNTGDLSTVFIGEDRWLEIQVGADAPMTPRQRIVSVANSIRSGSAANADDVLNKDINPNSVTIPAFGQVIDSNGQWVGDPTGLVGPQGPQGATGAQGSPGTSFNDLSVIKFCGRRDIDRNEFDGFIFPMNWSNDSCRRWACERGWERWSIALLYDGGNVSFIVRQKAC